MIVCTSDCDDITDAIAQFFDKHFLVTAQPATESFLQKKNVLVERN